MSKLMSLLFDTHAFKICDENKPFWYTSGKIGPYFINADYLYGSEKDSKNLLDFIDEELNSKDKNVIPSDIFQTVLKHYNTNEIYHFVIDSLKEYIEKNIDIEQIDYVSGGERRDWYFSNIIAYLLKKPHITIYKDLSTVESNFDFTNSIEISNLPGKKVLHIADLLNQSASFTRAWIPAIKNLGSSIVWSVFMVDRKNGGTEVLASSGVEVHSLIKIDDSLFLKAFNLGIINNSQLEMLRDFTKNPDESMKNFLQEHPEFIKQSLESNDSRTLKRVNTLIEQNIYNLNLKK